MIDVVEVYIEKPDRKNFIVTRLTYTVTMKFDKSNVAMKFTNIKIKLLNIFSNIKRRRHILQKSFKNFYGIAMVLLLGGFFEFNNLR